MSVTTEKESQVSTREQLLLSALKCFGHRDYDAVSTREIVEAAGANISAISYHFGGKEQLYLATADYLAERIQSEIEPLLRHIRERFDDADREGCLQLLKHLIDSLVHNLLFGELSEDAAGLIFREQNHPTKAFDSLYEKFMLPIQQIYSMLIGKITAADPESIDIKLMTHTLMGQIVIYRMGRETILRRIGKKSFTQEDISKIAEQISKATLKAVS